jgi:hypothetical protein
MADIISISELFGLSVFLLTIGSCAVHHVLVIFNETDKIRESFPFFLYEFTGFILWEFIFYRVFAIFAKHVIMRFKWKGLPIVLAVPVFTVYLEVYFPTSNHPHSPHHPPTPAPTQLVHRGC